MKSVVRCLFSFCLMAFSATVQAGANALATAAAATSPVLAFEGGLWFDGDGFVPATWYAVNGRFTAKRPTRIDATINLKGRYVLPPFAEAHNHDAQSGHTAPKAVAKNLGQGVFYSVQLCSRPDSVADFSGLMNQPGMLDVLFAGACITSSDGHPLGLALADAKAHGQDVSPEEMRKLWDVMDTVPDVERLWPQIAERKPDLVKLILVNSERFAENRQMPELYGVNGLDPKLIAPIVERARRDGVRVVVHADSAADFATAVAAGADFVAHLPGYRFAAGMRAGDYRIPDEVVAEAARRGTVVMTTAVAAKHFLERKPEHRAELMATQADNLRRLRAAGVRLALGSDDFMGTVVDEILYLDALKIMPRAELIRRATTDTPKALFPKRAIGGFGEGMEASLIAFDADPLGANLDVIRTPSIRVKQGSLLAPAVP